MDGIRARAVVADTGWVPAGGAEDDLDMSLGWSSDVDAGAWLVASVHGFGRDVGSVVPHGFDAYARIFHPIEDGPCTRWSDLAASNGRVAHPEMQYHLIASSPGEAPTSYEPLTAMSVGSLPRPELDVLAAILAGHTTTPEACWFAVWEGYLGCSARMTVGGWRSALGRLSGLRRRDDLVPGPAPLEVLAGPTLELPNRSYLLLHGSVTDATGPFDLLRNQSPNLWWPEDRTWCVATGIDFGWTYLAGSAELIDEVVACGDLEAWPATITDGIRYGSDHVNARLDRS